METVVFSKTFWWTMSTTLFLFLVIVATALFLLFYPFKTVVFHQPIEIMNPDKRVPLLGTVHMHIVSTKYTNAPGLIIRTLIRRRGKEIYVLDSSTVVSNRPAGVGPVEAYFALTANSFMLGKDTSIIFSIYYTLFKFRPIMVQFETEPFEIYDPKKVDRGSD